MKTIEVPTIARALFLRLSRGENRLLSRNGPDEDAELFHQVEAEGGEDACRAYFAVLGFRLERGDGHYYCQIFGGNGHGKSTLLRAVLFFYLGTNDKPLYSLDETKKDLISYYLGDPPSYLIYGVARGEGQPSFHIAVSRPTGKIQFYFVDAPYYRDCFVDRQMALPIEDVQRRWREAKCVVETFSSYEDFHHRIYGIIPSAYAVFRPATKNSAQVGVLSRIISGIFTVNQLEADKLKSALTCGVRRDAQAAELDLSQLKNQLTHFHRVNRAVRTYLHHEQGAIELVELAETFGMVRDERQRALEDLVRAAKLLPEERCKLVEQTSALKNEREAAEAAHAAERGRISQVIEELGKEIAVLEGRIKEAGAIQREYNSREIARKTKEVNSLPEREDEQRVAQRELEALATKYVDENQRKNHLLAVVRQSWTEAYARIQQQRLAIEEDFRKASEKLDTEKEAARVRMELERAVSIETLSPRQSQLDVERTALNKDWKVFGELSPPPEIGETEAKMNQADHRQREEGTRQEQHRNELALVREKLKGEREGLERDAATERERINQSIGRMQTERSRIERELEAFDTCLARFFQEEAPDQWPDAAKTLNRETLFSNAQIINARSSTGLGAWGVEFSTDTLPEPAQSFDRDALAKTLREVQKCLAEEKDALLGAQSRFVSDADAFEKASSQTVSTLQTKILASGELRTKARDEGVRFENKLINLRSQFAAMKGRREDLEKRETAWTQATSLLQKESADMEAGFRVRLKALQEDFRIRKTTAALTREEQRVTIDRDEAAATVWRDEESARVEQESRERLAADGASALQFAAAQKRTSNAEQEIKRISDFRDEVAEYRKKKVEWIDQLPAWQSELKARNESLQAQEFAKQQASERHRVAVENFQRCQSRLNEAIDAVTKDEEAVFRFRKDPRFVSEFGYFEREDLTEAAFHQSGATREFLIRNICNKNAAFDDGIRQVRKTAESVQARLAETNFVDVLDSIELKVERVDNQLTRTLAGLEAFAGISFGRDHDLFGKRADQGQVDQAIEHFERLMKEIGRYPTTQLSLTDYFDFVLRVHENGRDMGWRKSLNHIGSTGTDYLVKMLIYLALIEVYQERAIDPKVEATVHCVLDETGVLAPKYVRYVLAYAATRGIILVTAGHSQQITGFEYWMFVRKVGSRFAGQKALRKVLKCD